MKYDLRKPTVWAVKLGIRVGIFYACKQEKSQENPKQEETEIRRDFDESCSNFKNHMERKKEEQK